MKHELETTDHSLDAVPPWLSGIVIRLLSSVLTPQVDIEFGNGEIIRTAKSKQTAERLWNKGYRFPGQILFSSEGRLVSVNPWWERMDVSKLPEIELSDLLKVKSP